MLIWLLWAGVLCGQIGAYSCLGAPGAPGVLSLGGADPQLFTGDMAYVPFADSCGHYAVNLQAIGINGVEQVCTP